MKKLLFLLLIPLVSFGQNRFEVVPLTDNYLEQSRWSAVQNSDAGRAGVRIWFKEKTPVGKRNPNKKAVMHHTFVDYNYYYDGKETKLSSRQQFLNWDLVDGFYIEPLGRIRVKFLLNKTRDTLKIEHKKATIYKSSNFEKVIYFTKEN